MLNAEKLGGLAEALEASMRVRIVVRVRARELAAVPFDKIVDGTAPERVFFDKSSEAVFLRHGGEFKSVR